MQRSTPPRFIANTIVRHRNLQRHGRILGSFWVQEFGWRNYHVRVFGGQPVEQVWREGEIVFQADPLPAPGATRWRVREPLGQQRW